MATLAVVRRRLSQSVRSDETQGRLTDTWRAPAPLSDPERLGSECCVETRPAARCCRGHLPPKEDSRSSMCAPKARRCFQVYRSASGQRRTRRNAEWLPWPQNVRRFTLRAPAMQTRGDVRGAVIGPGTCGAREAPLLNQCQGHAPGAAACGQYRLTAQLRRETLPTFPPRSTRPSC